MTAAAERFWTSKAARHFPYSVEINEKTVGINEQDDFYRKLYRRISSAGWIPTHGVILELGAGASSGLLFPTEILRNRLTVTDISRPLLARNPARKKQILNAGRDHYPQQWNNMFTLAFALHLSRYLDSNEKIHLAQETRRVLAPGGTILLLDTPQLGTRQVANIMGENQPFDTFTESAILDGVGFEQIQSGTVFIDFFNRWNERVGTTIDYVMANSWGN